MPLPGVPGGSVACPQQRPRHEATLHRQTQRVKLALPELGLWLCRCPEASQDPGSQPGVFWGAAGPGAVPGGGGTQAAARRGAEQSRAVAAACSRSPPRAASSPHGAGVWKPAGEGSTGVCGGGRRAEILQKNQKHERCPRIPCPRLGGSPRGSGLPPVPCSPSRGHNPRLLHVCGWP